MTGDLTASGLALVCVALIARGSRRGVAARALELGAAPYTAPGGSAGGVCPVTNETTLWRALTRTFEDRRLFARARFVSGSTDRWCAQMLFELEDQPGVPVSSVFCIPKQQRSFEAKLAAVEERVGKQPDLSTMHQIATDAIGEAIRAERAERDRAIDAVAEETRGQVEALIGVKVAALEERVGKQPDLSAVRRTVTDAIGEAIRTERAERDHAIGAVAEEARRAAKTEVMELEERLRETTGKVPIARAWKPESVTYAGAFVTDEGSTWQAVRDTAKRPGESEDFVLIALAGKDGRDGRSIALRGEYDPQESYTRLDVVTKAGSCWVALRDNPGVLGHSDGWLLLTAHGERGGARRTWGPRT